MKDILLIDGDDYIECELNGLELTYTYSDELKCHYVSTLHNKEAYEELKRELDDICNEEGYEEAREYLNYVDFNDRFFVKDSHRMYFDLRSRDEIHEYEKEACDKVWLMRLCNIANKTPLHEVSRPAMNRILSTYDDIPKDGYTDWECGYWNGIMGALRWVLGDEKDFLDT